MWDSWQSIIATLIFIHYCFAVAMSILSSHMCSLSLFLLHKGNWQSKNHTGPHRPKHQLWNCPIKGRTGSHQCFYVHFYCQHLTAGRGRQIQVTSWLSPPPWTGSWWSPPSWPGDAPLCACVPLLSLNDELRPDRCETEHREFKQQASGSQWFW